MAYLSNQNNEIIIDAVLTKYGREKLSQQGSLGITKFALSDDEVDYGLYNTDHPMGTDYYDIAIASLPTLEALPGDNLSMKYKLITNREGSLESISALQVSYPSAFDEANGISQAGVSYTFNPFIIPAPDVPSRVYYISEIVDTLGIDLTFERIIDPTIGITNEINQATNEYAAKQTTSKKFGVGHSFKITINTLPKTKTKLTVVVQVGGSFSVREKSFYIYVNPATV
jgi:hypothetical protein